MCAICDFAKQINSLNQILERLFNFPKQIILKDIISRYLYAEKGKIKTHLWLQLHSTDPSLSKTFRYRWVSELRIFQVLGS